MTLKTSAIIASAILSIHLSGYSQSLRYPLALPYLNLNAYSASQADPLSFTANQAALAKINQVGAGVYGERRFLLAATSSYAAAFVLPSRLGNFGVALNYSGFKNFNENKIGLAYSRSLGTKIDIGIQFNYYSYRIPSYPSGSSVNLEAGVIMHLSDKLNAGAHVFNPVGGKLGKLQDEKLATAYKFGLGYDASDNFFVGSEIVKEEDKPVNVIAGFQYQFARQFFVRSGMMSESSTVFAGVGVGFKNLRLDIAGSYHQLLGFSPGLLFIVNFGTKKEQLNID